jgi:hypothetical protein
MEGFGGEGIHFSFKLRTPQNGFSTQLSVIEVLYDHLSHSLNLQNSHFQNPSRKPSQTDPYVQSLNIN